jgi:hypothetical protein
MLQFFILILYFRSYTNIIRIMPWITAATAERATIRPNFFSLFPSVPCNRTKIERKQNKIIDGGSSERM